MTPVTGILFAGSPSERGERRCGNQWRSPLALSWIEQSGTWPFSCACCRSSVFFFYVAHQFGMAESAGSANPNPNEAFTSHFTIDLRAAHFEHRCGLICGVEQFWLGVRGLLHLLVSASVVVAWRRRETPSFATIPASPQSGPLSPSCTLSVSEQVWKRRRKGLFRSLEICEGQAGGGYSSDPQMNLLSIPGAETECLVSVHSRHALKRGSDELGTSHLAVLILFSRIKIGISRDHDRYIMIDTMSTTPLLAITVRVLSIPRQLAAQPRSPVAI